MHVAVVHLCPVAGDRTFPQIEHLSGSVHVAGVHLWIVKKQIATTAIIEAMINRTGRLFTGS